MLGRAPRTKPLGQAPSSPRGAP